MEVGFGQTDRFVKATLWLVDSTIGWQGYVLKATDYRAGWLALGEIHEHTGKF